MLPEAVGRCSWISLISRMSSASKSRTMSSPPGEAGQVARLVGEAARDQLGAGSRRRRGSRPRSAHRPRTRRGSRSATSEMSPTPAVDERHAGLDAAREAGRRSRKLDDVAVLGDHDRARRHACFLRESGMRLHPYSPWIGIIAFGRTSESSVRTPRRGRVPRRARPRSPCAGPPRRSSSSGRSHRARALVAGHGRAEMITVSPRSTLIAGGRCTRCA